MRKHMPQPIRWSRVFFGVALGMLLLVSAQIALAGTTFIDGEKVETCQGSTCSPGGGNNGGGSPPVTITSSPKAAAKAASSSRATSSSRSSARSSSGSSSNSTSAASTGPVTNSVAIGGNEAGAYAPDVTAIPTAPCRVGVGGSAGWVGGALGLSFSTLDEGCDAWRDAIGLQVIGRQDAALRRLCQKAEVADALGAECPQKPKEAEPTRGAFDPH